MSAAGMSIILSGQKNDSYLHSFALRGGVFSGLGGLFNEAGDMPERSELNSDT